MTHQVRGHIVIWQDSRFFLPVENKNLEAFELSGISNWNMTLEEKNNLMTYFDDVYNRSTREQRTLSPVSRVSFTVCSTLSEQCPF